MEESLPQLNMFCPVIFCFVKVNNSTFHISIGVVVRGGRSARRGMGGKAEARPQTVFVARGFFLRGGGGCQREDLARVVATNSCI